MGVEISREIRDKGCSTLSIRSLSNGFIIGEKTITGKQLVFRQFVLFDIGCLFKARKLVHHQEPAM